MKDDKGFSATDSDMGDVYPLQLRLSVQRETNSFEVRISKKVRLFFLASTPGKFFVSMIPVQEVGSG